jgi:hypothetical protein
VRCRVEIGRWVHGCAPISIDPLATLPVSAWWWPEAQYASAPAMPGTAEA